MSEEFDNDEDGDRVQLYERNPPKFARLKGPPARKALSHAAEELRSAWVTAVRKHHEARNNRPSVYDAGPRWDGGYDSRSGRTWKNPVWPGLLERIRKTGFRVDELIVCLFGTWGTDNSPTPWALVSRENLDAAEKERVNRRIRIASSLKTQEAVYKADVWGKCQSVPDPKEAVRRVLNDVGRSVLSPLFRYSAAIKKELPDVATRWRQAAVAQLLQDPKPYLEFWSAVIPEDLQEMAKAAIP
jgi:hypothetical protein